MRPHDRPSTAARPSDPAGSLRTPSSLRSNAYCAERISESARGGWVAGERAGRVRLAGLRQSRAPIPAPLRGSKKLETGIEPVAVRGPVTTDGSTLSSAASFQVPPMFHELPLAVDDRGHRPGVADREVAGQRRVLHPS